MIFKIIKNYLMVVIVSVRKCTSALMKTITFKRIVSVKWVAWSCIRRWISRIVGITAFVIRNTCIRWNCFGIYKFIKNNFKHKNKNNRTNDKCQNFQLKRQLQNTICHSTSCNSAKHTAKINKHHIVKNLLYQFMRCNHFSNGWNFIFKIITVFHKNILAFQYLIISEITPINQENIA